MVLSSWLSLLQLGLRVGSCTVLVGKPRLHTPRVRVCFFFGFWCFGWFVGIYVVDPSIAHTEKAEAEKSEAAFRFSCAQRKSLYTRPIVRHLTADALSLGAHANTL